MQNVNYNTTLVFSYNVFKEFSMVVNKDMTRQTIALKEDINQTEEVVVIGRGTQRKISVVGAVTNVKSSELQVPAASVSNMLGGRVQGIIAVTRSGEPGSKISETSQRFGYVVLEHLVLVLQLWC